MLLDTNKIIFTGPVGAGKTTAIGAISEEPPVGTDVPCTDESKAIKQNTTVAMDYSYIELEDGKRVHLYGTPGQERFNFMWNILSKGGLGLVLLVNNDHPDPVGQMEFYLDAFKKAIGGGEALISDPTKNTVALSEYIFNHLKMNDGRMRYIHLIKEIIEDPYEIWLVPMRNKETGAVKIRKRYLKLVRDNKNRYLLLVAESKGAAWEGFLGVNIKPVPAGGKPGGRNCMGRAGGWVWETQNSLISPIRSRSITSIPPAVITISSVLSASACP